MRLLFKSNAQIHGVYGMRPAICWAADAGQLAAVSLLLAGEGAKVAKVNDRCPFGFTALLDAAKGCHLPVVEALLAVRCGGDNFCPRLYVATLPAHSQIHTHPPSHSRVPRHLQAGADVNAQTKTGTTALMFAAERNSMSVVTALLAAKPNMALATEAGYTAETLARVSGHMEMAHFLNANAKSILPA